MNQPKTLDQLWSEKDLCERFGLRMGKGHSVTIAYWIRAGLKCVEISGRRFFWERDVIEFVMQRQKRQREAQGEG
jgi:hypothetical protein